MYYSPVRHSCIATRVRLACVKPAASVRSEPESNSQVLHSFDSLLRDKFLKTEVSTNTLRKNSYIPKIWSQIFGNTHNITIDKCALDLLRLCYGIMH